MSDRERLDEMVSVPRWVLDELIPMSLGALELLRKMKEARHPSAVSDDEIARGENAITVAYEALHGSDG